MEWPSAPHAGLFTNQRFSFDTCRASLPSASTVQMFHSPSRSDEKAMRLPSGLKRGCMSKAGPLVIRSADDAPLPPTGMV